MKLFGWLVVPSLSQPTKLFRMIDWRLKLYHERVIPQNPAVHQV